MPKFSKFFETIAALSSHDIIRLFMAFVRSKRSAEGYTDAFGKFRQDPAGAPYLPSQILYRSKRENV